MVDVIILKGMFQTQLPNILKNKVEKKSGWNNVFMYEFTLQETV